MFPKYNTQGFLKAPFNISTPIVHTGTTAETIIWDESPNLVGLIQANDYFEFEVIVNATNNANAKALLFYISDSQDTLLNQVLVGKASAGAGWATTARVHRFLKMNGSLNSNTYLDNGTTHLNVNNVYANGTSPIKTNGTIDFGSVGKYLILAAQNANAGDTLNVYFGNSQIARP